MIGHYCHSWDIYFSHEYIYIHIIIWILNFIYFLLPQVYKAPNWTHLFERIIAKYEIALQHQWFRKIMLKDKDVLNCSGFTRQSSLYTFMVLLLKPISVELQVVNVSLGNNIVL